ncbi:DinB family protein [Geodermatophilus sp. SYSU D00079]
MDAKEDLLTYLHARQADLLAKLDGLDEYAVRRPMTPTGTNLLGLVKHVAYVQLGYFGEVFGRPSGRSYPWDDGEDDADMWATADERREDVVELHRFSAAHADATIEALPLDAVGEVPWWREDRRRPTLHTVLVHVCVEVARHAGHADVVRELVDGSVGMSAANPNVPERSAAEWAVFRERIEAAARQAAGRDGAPDPTGGPRADG